MPVLANLLRLAAILKPTTAQTSTDAYADIAGSLMDVSELGLKSIAFQFTELNVNAVTVRVMASIDGSVFEALTVLKNDGTAYAAADIAVAKNGSQTAFTSNATSGTGLVHGLYRYYKGQVKATAGGSQGSVTMAAVAKS